MNKKIFWTLINLGVCGITVATVVPLVYTVLSNNKTIESYDNLPTEVHYDNKATPISDGSYAFSTYDKKSNSINYSNGPTGVTPSEGVEKNANISRRYLFNEYEVKQAQRTVGINYYSYGGSGIHSGTGWILDYKITEGNSYPLTWYFATNAHVIQNLKVPYDTMTPERYETNDNYNNTEYIEFINLKDFTLNKDLGTTATSNTSHQATRIKIINDEGQPKAKTIFIGNDFLKTSPKMYSKTDRWQRFEEYADFAVMEMTFDNEEEARTVTMNYANNKDNQFKYKKESLLARPDKIKKNNYSVVGFPASPNNVYVSSISVSKHENPTEKEQKTLTNLATSPFYNSYEDVKGIMDAAISLSFFGYEYRQYVSKEKDDDFFLSWGLMYPVDYGSLTGGSSGSMLMDSEGHTLGIHFAGDFDASIGLAQALYCEGFDYQGIFGRYNLEGYDLIDGGFINQKKSYRDSMIQMYGKENLKTNLYPNGINR